MPLPKITIEVLSPTSLKWFVEVAAVNMLKYELGREELVNLDGLYNLAGMGMDDGTAFVAKADDVCVGAIGGILMPNIFNPDLNTLTEVFWYVLPQYRQTRAGILLLSAFTAKGKEVADETTLSLLTTSSIKVETLEKRGYMLSEFSFRKQNKE